MNSMIIETPVTEKQKEKLLKKNGTEHPRTVGQLQKI